MSTVNIMIDDILIPRKTKFILDFDGAKHECISAAHASQLLKRNGYNFSACDIYNYCSPKRGKKRLNQRGFGGDNFTITKL